MGKRKVSFIGAVALLFSLTAAHWMGASASDAMLKSKAKPDDSANGITLSVCHQLGVSTSQIPQPSPVKQGEVFDPGSDWISNSKAQSAIEDFWKTINHLHIDVVGAHIDLERHQFIFVIGPEVDSDVMMPAVVELRGYLSVEIQRGCRSRAELDGIVERISNWVTTEKPGVKLSISVNELHSAAKIETDSQELSELVAAEQSLSNLPIEVLVGSQVPVPLVRCADTAPHYGGARYGGDNSCGVACTAGFKVRRISDGAVGMSTAGHCRETTGWSGNLYSGYSFYGAFSSWNYGNGDDWGFIVSSSYSPNYYTDPCCPSVRTSSGGATPVVGNSLCISGYVTGARCSMIVQSLSYQNYDPAYNRTITNVRAIRSDGTNACREGDSGAPWFSSTTSKVYGIESFGISTGGPICYFNQVNRMIADGFQVMIS